VARSGGKFDAVLRARRAPGETTVPDGSGDHRRSAYGGGQATSLGKRSNTEYRQVSAYIRKDTHRRVKMALLEEDRQFSELVAELLETWLEERT
jgi:hypothetical protein